MAETTSPTPTQQASYDLARQVLADPVARAMFQQMIERTAQGEPVPDDFSWLEQRETVWVPDKRWRLVRPGEKRICRQPRCDNTAVAAFLRAHRTINNRLGTQWWRYCIDHLYGRRIVAGVVGIDVAKGSPAAEQGYF